MLLYGDIMLHGRGHQYKLTKEYNDLLNDALYDRNKLTDEELLDVNLEDAEGHNEIKYKDTYYKKNVPMPADRSQTKIDRRDTDPTLGEVTR